MAFAGVDTSLACSGSVRDNGICPGRNRERTQRHCATTPPINPCGIPQLEIGRDVHGRFRKGNPGGPGNPFARKVAALRKALLDSVSEQDLKEIVVDAEAEGAAGRPGSHQYVVFSAVMPRGVRHSPDTGEGGWQPCGAEVMFVSVIVRVGSGRRSSLPRPLPVGRTSDADQRRARYQTVITVRRRPGAIAASSWPDQSAAPVRRAPIP